MIFSCIFLIDTVRIHLKKFINVVFMQSTLIMLQVFFSILFILSVLLQDKGSAASLTFGGGDNNDTFYGSKQGADKFLAIASYIFGTLFCLNAIVYIALV